ncbi:hypothetical protein COHA_004548 [Chlorella ohadii]|uniref:Uncharacterized protein n=1 Tax=Chlorella ohadii TaxID=2649997 RepID=A0AAD5DSW7_9CHLO|nr:hypothetical protein COHA_004548 [Chlorella ohadii]
MRRPSPPPTLSVRMAHYVFGLCLLAVTVTTFLQLGGVAAQQALCHDNQLLEYWTPAYAAFLAQMAPLKPWTCKWWQITQWWTIALQLSFWMCLTISWLWGTLERYFPALFAHGATATTMCVATSLMMMGESTYYTGKVYNLGLIAFYGFFIGSILNGLLGFSLCELLHAKRAARRRTEPPSTSPSIDSIGTVKDAAAHHV